MADRRGQMLLVVAILVAMVAVFMGYCGTVKANRRQGQAAAADNLSALLTWEKPTNLGEAGGELYYVLDAEPCRGNSCLASAAFSMKIPGDKTSQTLDDKLLPGYEYRLALKACNAAGCSSPVQIQLSTIKPKVTTTSYSPATLATKNTPFSLIMQTDADLAALSTGPFPLSADVQVCDAKACSPINAIKDSCKPLDTPSKRFSCDFDAIPEANYVSGNTLTGSIAFSDPIWGDYIGEPKQITIKGKPPGVVGDFNSHLVK